jgi:hypothetical protein
VGVVVTNAAPGASCAWTFDNGQDPAPGRPPCRATRRCWLRVRYGRPTIGTADIPLPDGTIKRLTAEILVRDLLIAGLGDSIASGEAIPTARSRSPTKASASAAFSHRAKRLLPAGPRRLPRQTHLRCNRARAPTRIGRSTAPAGSAPPAIASLYGYQMRTALALAVQNPHVAVTLLRSLPRAHQIPRACSTPKAQARSSAPDAAPARRPSRRSSSSFAMR